MTETICTRARTIIDEDPTITIRFLSLELEVNYLSTHVLEELTLRKKCATWIPYLLSDDQKKDRVLTYMLWMAMFEPNGPKLFSDVAAGGDCWISFCI